MMDKKEILQQIIDNHGSCDFLYRTDDSAKQVCARCPMNQLENDGRSISCYTAIAYPLMKKDGMSGLFTFPHVSIVDKAYLDKATELLSEILIEEMLTGDKSEQ